MDWESFRIALIVRAGCFDLAGKQIDVLISDYLPAGNHQLVWNAQNQVSGVYLVRLESDAETQIRRMTLLK